MIQAMIYHKIDCESKIYLFFIYSFVTFVLESILIYKEEI